MVQRPPSKVPQASTRPASESPHGPRRRPGLVRLARRSSTPISVAEVGFEPTRPCGQGILSPQRLPFRHSAWAFGHAELGQVVFGLWAVRTPLRHQSQPRCAAGGPLPSGRRPMIAAATLFRKQKTTHRAVEKPEPAQVYRWRPPTVWTPSQDSCGNPVHKARTTHGAVEEVDAGRFGRTTTCIVAQ